jgi:DNA polymerase (family 10)
MGKNAEVARILYLIADILDIEDVKFKPAAYRKAARNIENLERNIEDVHKDGELKKIPGVGEAISSKIEEFLDTGRIRYLEKLMEDAPRDMEKMVRIQGLGPKTIGLIYRELGIGTLEDLERAAREGKLRVLKGVGEKTEKLILDGMVLHKREGERMLLGHALPLAEEIVAELKAAKVASKVEYAGSLRRMRSTIGDIDIIAVSRAGAKSSKKLMDTFTTLPRVKDILAKGGTKSSVVTDNNVQVDLRVVKPDEFGAALQYFTGSKDHNVHLRSLARSRGYKVSEYGIFKGKRKVGGRTEREVYKKLKLDLIPPELREDRGEIEAAAEGKLPTLVKQGDIRGDLHVHTDKSDGTDSLLKMLRAAKERGYEYVAITEHSESLRMSGLKGKELLAWAKQIRSTGKKVGIGALAGVEVEILKDGSIDYEGEGVLEKLDIVIGAVHSHFKLGRKDQMNRLENALDHKQLNVLAHPTCRIIGKREPINIDIEELIGIAKRTRTVLEIDSFPDRMDLGSRHVKLAKKAGVKVCISSDAHAVVHYDHMRWGLAQARRGWLSKKDVINTFTLKRLRSYLKGGK